MIQGEINLIYVEVEKLLNDICNFLNEEISNGYISKNGRSLASNLIERSKKQLQSIAVVANTDGPDGVYEPYVDMQSCKKTDEPAEQQEVYSEVSLTIEGVQYTEDFITCPYANLPASEIKEGKFGNLYRKDKILFFVQQKKLYAAVQNSWLLLYMNENSLKPCSTYDLSQYKAKLPSSEGNDKKSEECFDLIRIADSKPLHFTALTSKDSMQWIAAINRQSERSVVKRSLPPVPNNHTQEDDTDEPNEYEPLKEYQLKQISIHQAPNQNNIRAEPLPLPPRNAMLKRESSDESLSNYDFVGTEALHPLDGPNDSSFSEDDSDTYYDNPSELKTRKSQYNSSSIMKKHEENNHSNSKQNLLKAADEDDEDGIYDYLQTPIIDAQVTNSQRELVAGKQNEKNVKPKPIIKPKILLFRNKKK